MRGVIAAKGHKMEQAFDVTGMTCAACSARVTKATEGVAGVDRAVVNLLKNSMVVDYDGNPDTLRAVSAAVEKRPATGPFPVRRAPRRRPPRRGPRPPNGLRRR